MFVDFISPVAKQDFTKEEFRQGEYSACVGRCEDKIFQCISGSSDFHFLEGEERWVEPP